MFKFAFGLLFGIVAGIVGSFIAAIAAVVIIEDSPETINMIKDIAAN